MNEWVNHLVFLFYAKKFNYNILFLDMNELLAIRHVIINVMIVTRRI